MQISLENFKTNNLRLSTNILDFSETNEDTFELNLQVGIANSSVKETDSKKAVILFTLDLIAKDKFQLTCDYEAIFLTDTILTKELVISEKFLNINAPAIAYPYLRAFVSNVLLVSNLDPAVLPTLNFQKLYDNNLKRSDSEN